MRSPRSRFLLSAAFMLLCWAWTALGHSAMTCADYRPPGDLHSAKADEDCHARPRGFKRAMFEAGDVACLVYRPGNGGHAADAAPEYGNICPQFSSFGKNGFACDQDLQRRTVPFDAGYDPSTAPYAVYKKGRGVCLEWPAYGHAQHILSPQYPNGTGVPYSVGPVYVLATPAKPDSDVSEKDFWDGGGGKPLAMLPYDDCSLDPSSSQGFLQHKYYNDSGPPDRARPCRGCFNVPTTMATGLWTFQWLYEMNKDEWYTTCWDAVISDTGDSYTAPSGRFKTPLPRSDTLPSAGVGTTFGWKAVPLNQVSSAAPTCPPGLSGQLCTAGGAGAATVAPSSSPGLSGSPATGTAGLTSGTMAPITATGSTVRPNGATFMAPLVPGYEVVPGQELHNKYDYSCPGTISTLPDKECQHDGEPAQLAQLCNADFNCQVFAWYQFGSGGRTVPTAWFKGGPTKQDVHAYSSPSNPDAVLYIKQTVSASSGPASGSSDRGGNSGGSGNSNGGVNPNPSNGRASTSSGGSGNDITGGATTYLMDSQLSGLGRKLAALG